MQIINHKIRLQGMYLGLRIAESVMKEEVAAGLIPGLWGQLLSRVDGLPLTHANEAVRETIFQKVKEQS